MVFFVLRLIDWMVPDVPESLELKVKRERYLAKQALADNQEALLVSNIKTPDSGHTHSVHTISAHCSTVHGLSDRLNFY